MSEPEEARKRPSVARGAAILAASRVVAIAAALISTAILARLVSPAAFGVFAAMFVIIALPYAILEGAFGTALLQRASINDATIRLMYRGALGVSVLMAVVIVVAAQPLAALLQAPALTGIILLGALALPLRAIASVSIALLVRDRRYTTVAVVTTVGGILGNFAVSVPLALFGYQETALAAGTLAGAVAEAFLAAYLLRPKVFGSVANAENDLSLGGLFGLSQLLNWAALYAPSIIVTRLLGTEALGYYSRSWRLMEIATSVTAGPMQRALIPDYAEKRERVDEARAGFANGIVASAILFGLPAAIAIAQMDLIVRLLFGAQWLPLILATQILFAGFFPRAAYKITESLMIGFGRAGQTASRQALFLALMIGGALAGAPYGLTGVAIGVAGAQWILYATSLYTAARLLDTPLWAVIGWHARPGAAVVSVGILMWIVRDATLPALGLYASHIVSIITGGSAVALLLCLPARVIGAEAQALRARVQAIFERLTRRLRSALA